MPTESPKWKIPVLGFGDHNHAEIVVYAVGGNVVMMPPAAEGAYIVPPKSIGLLNEALREAHGFAERRQGPS